MRSSAVPEGARLVVQAMRLHGNEELELFRSRLENIADPRQRLVRLATLIDRRRFDAAFDALYTDGVGRPELSTRTMVGSHMLTRRSVDSRVKPGRLRPTMFSRWPGRH
jgi:hypothetical protein